MTQIIAKIDWQEGITLNFYNEDLSQFKRPFCDHCNANHNLRYTYIVKLDNGTMTQLGEDCLQHVMGYKPNVEPYESYNSFYDFFGGKTSSRYYNTERFLYIYLSFLKTIKGSEIDYKSIELKDIISQDFLKTLISKSEDFTEAKAIINFYKDLEATNNFTQNLKNLMTSESFDIKYFNIFKYCFKVYDSTINYKPLYNSKITDYTTTQVKEIEFIGTRNYSGYSWETESKKYRIIDTQNNVFEFSTSTDLQIKVGDKISFKYSMSFGNKIFQNTKKYGFVNRIRNLKIIG